MNIIQRFIPTSNKDTRPCFKMKPTHITIHETDNTGFKANAESHARLQEGGNPRKASWHLQIDDTYAIQSVPFDEVAWAAGDGDNGPGNRKSIHIEMCVNSDGNYKKTVTNTAEVTKQLMQQFNIPITNVVQHNKWSGKNCPRHLRAGDWGICWADFINLVKKEEVKKVSATYTDKVTVPNTAYWQAASLVQEYQAKGFKCYADPVNYKPFETPKDSDAFRFVVETDFKNASLVSMELKRKGYSLAVWETI